MITDTKQEAALHYLAADRLLHAGMIYTLQSGAAEILHAADDGVLLHETNSDAYMLSAASYEQGVAIIETLNTAELFLLHQEFMVEHIRRKYAFTTAWACVQAVYTQKEPLPLRGCLEIKRLDMSYLPQVLAQYHAVDDPAYIEKLLQRGNIYGGFAEGKLCGFVGSHPEGSIGLLEIIPAYRRRGYATEMESFMVNRVLAAGLTPYGQVFVGNEDSLRLQAKLGFEFSAAKVYWTF